MSGNQKFSEAWHQLYAETVQSSGRHWLREIEEQLAHYESIWRNQEPFDSESFGGTNPETIAGQLRVAAINIGLLQRVTLCRSIHLIGEFVRAINRDDFDSAPFLLRAVMEQAALGFHAIRRIRHALAVLRRDEESGKSWEELLSDAQLSALFGAKVNFGAIVEEVRERLSRGEEVDYAVEEIEIVRRLIEQGRLAESSIQPDDLPFKSRNIIDIIRDLSSENPQEGAPPNAIELEWAYFSQYCHPSGFAWSFALREVFAGGRDYNPSSEAVDRRRKALASFVGPMWEWVLNLPGLAIEKLAELESEVEREANALEGKP